jgi:hypothetical protein
MEDDFFVELDPEKNEYDKTRDSDAQQLAHALAFDGKWI